MLYRCPVCSCGRSAIPEPRPFGVVFFAHDARWNGAASRVEMHLVSGRRQVIEIPRARCRITFERGESIWTESSYTFEPRGLEQLGARAGLTVQEQWVDGAAGFALTLFRRA